MNVSPIKDKKWYEDQVHVISEGLKRGKRLAYNKETQQFEVLKGKIKDEKLETKLWTMSPQIAEVFKNYIDLGGSDKLIKQVHEAALSRYDSLARREGRLFLRDKVKDHIQSAKYDLEVLAELAKKYIKITLDETSLLTAIPRNIRQSEGSKHSIQEIHKDWYIHQALLLEDIEKKDPEVAKELGLAILQGFSKAAKLDPVYSEKLNIQKSPIDPKQPYYRGGTIWQDNVNRAYYQKMGVKGLDPEHIQIVNSPMLCREVVSREGLSELKIHQKIETEEDFIEAIDEFIDKVSKEEVERSVIFNLEDYFAANECKSIQQQLEQWDHLKIVLVQRINLYIEQNPQCNAEDLKKLIRSIQPFSLIEFEGQNFIFTPNVIHYDPSIGKLKTAHFSDFLNHNGLRPSPDEIKKAWLQIEPLKEILMKLNIYSAELTTKGKPTPHVCENFNDFMNQPVVGKFKKLSEENDGSSYLKLLPAATIKLLKELSKHSIDEKYNSKELQNLLQASYFRMMNAMNEAIYRKDDFVHFHNQIELIHQEIQTILTIVKPYNQEMLSETIKSNLTIILEGIHVQGAHLMPSAMHAMSTAFGGVEKQKGTNKLKIAQVKDCYYEQNYLFDTAKNYQTSIVSGDDFDPNKKIPLDENAIPIDLFICEFHHNISLEKQVYKPENVLEQVKSLINNNQVADQFTVLIDTTMDLENSDEMKHFLSDPTIKERIQNGQLNIVLVRSAQKFDMLGMDNYYGGIVTVINDGNNFSTFNERMAEKQDQISGVAYQGVALLQKAAYSEIEQRRQIIMGNTKEFYQRIVNNAPNSIYAPENKNPFQISKIEDEKSIFLDVKFQRCPKSAFLFVELLMKSAHERGMPLSQRASFGFDTTNVTVINREPPLAPLVRINPGLEDVETRNYYADFIINLQKEIDRALIESPPGENETLDNWLCNLMMKLPL